MARPDLRHDLAADLRLARVVTGHDAVRRRDDGGAESTLDLRDLGGRDVPALTGPRDAAQPRDRRAAVVGVLQADLDDLARMVRVRRLDVEAGDVALLDEDACHLVLELARRDVDGLVRRRDGVADAGEEVCDRIRHGATSCSSSSPG
jgi:hypothetical protein